MELLQLGLHLRKSVPHVVVLLNIKLFTFRCFVKPKQLDPILGIRVAVLLSGEYIVGVHGHQRAVGGEIGHRFHNIPRVVHPCETGKESKLYRHGTQTYGGATNMNL